MEQTSARYTGAPAGPQEPIRAHPTWLLLGRDSWVLSTCIQGVKPNDNGGSTVLLNGAAVETSVPASLIEPFLAGARARLWGSATPQTQFQLALESRDSANLQVNGFGGHLHYRDAAEINFIGTPAAPAAPAKKPRKQRRNRTDATPEEVAGLLAHAAELVRVGPGRAEVRPRSADAIDNQLCFLDYRTGEWCITSRALGLTRCQVARIIRHVDGCKAAKLWSNQTNTGRCYWVLPNSAMADQVYRASPSG